MLDGVIQLQKWNLVQVNKINIYERNNSIGHLFEIIFVEYIVPLSWMTSTARF